MKRLVALFCLCLLTLVLGSCSAPLYRGEGVRCTGGDWSLASTHGPAGPSSERERRLQAAIQSYMGTPYVYGGNGRNGIDCSGLTQAVFREVGVEIPRTASSQAAAAASVSPAELRFGDLIFFDTEGNGSISHVGIYIGNGFFVHASSSRGVVRESLANPWYSARIVRAGRLL
ncbi:C40 family peptidase [Candidatus Fermentibacterales bacterium]|nr:C40 family peptidase [Candidatus Fermentibacterales bacterium]